MFFNFKHFVLSLLLAVAILCLVVVSLVGIVAMGFSEMARDIKKLAS